ncbi:hypothetical protein DES53_106243 [Roseimicrobium gellanilyticum]|uniref:Uncharacterized protein n=1 Tax=Roseimicrobium gellanilyticum TaxID=748857 RepID=A0A366HJW5_9BACT|nr:hypothetical protein [Roseimicrobium gellanilyticum]RBP42534.1 hypothetical protein DES53_106243 [Roseimicrobium gellanilyticum]
MCATHRSTVWKSAPFTIGCRTLVAIAALTLAPTCLTRANDPTPAQRLGELHTQFTETLDREVLTAHAAAAAKLRASYITALEQALAASTKAANLGDSLALRDEIKRINADPAAKPASTEPPPPTLAQLREKYEGALARLESDKDKKSQPYYAMYATVLSNYLKDLTKKGDLDGASSVQERLKEVAQKQPADAPKPAESRQAKVEIENVQMAPFRKGEPIHGDTDKFTWEDVPERFAGYQFSRDKTRYVGVLRFKVTSDGTVYLGCSDRWGGGGNDGPWKNEVITQSKMKSDGWKSVKAQQPGAMAETMDGSSSPGNARRANPLPSARKST